METHEGRHAFRVEVFPGDLKPDLFKVQLYAESLEEGGSELEAMTACKSCPASAGAFVYSAEVSTTRPAGDYTPRIVPYHADASVPLEASPILWQR